MSGGGRRPAGAAAGRVAAALLVMLPLVVGCRAAGAAGRGRAAAREPTTSASAGRTAPAAPDCEPVTVTGQAREGEAFEHPLPGDLAFRLSPSAPPVSGWTIEVRSLALADPENELSWSVTPPLRFWNPRYLDTSYGWTASEALAATERAFRFVRPADLASAVRDARLLLWPAGEPADSVAAALERREALATYEGVLRILDGRTTAEPAGPGRIESVTFEATLCVPVAEPGIGR